MSRARGHDRFHTESLRVGVTPTAMRSKRERAENMRRGAFFASHSHDGACLVCGKTALYQSWDYTAGHLVGACAAHRDCLPAMKPLR